MGIFDRFRPEPEQNGGVKMVDFTEVLTNYDFVDVIDGAMLVTPKRVQLQDVPTTREIGISGGGESVWSQVVRGDYNPELRGKLGTEKFDEMRRNDAQVRSSLRLVKTPVLGGRWYIEPASDRPRDKRIAEFVWNNLTKWMTVSWPQLLTEILLMLDYGHYIFEKVWDFKEVNGRTRVIWRKLAPRHPLDVSEWVFDRNGGVQGVKMYWDATGEKTIKIDKLMVFTFDKEAGNPEGISILRSAYKHWYYKENLYKIDAIQKERHGIGVPIISLPANFTPADKAAAENLGRNLRTNEKAHVVLPPNWEIMFAKIEGQPVNAIESIEHHNAMIYANVLGLFVQEGGQASQESAQDMFLKATRFIADIVRDVFNKYGIPQLVNYNWDVDEYPELRVRRIGETTDWRTLSFAVRNLIGAGLMRPDDKLEDWIRDEMDFPKVDLDSIRKVATPQGGPRVGPPRQTPPNAGPGNRNAGGDRSGG